MKLRSRYAAVFALAFLSVIGITGCDSSSSSQSALATPVSENDAALNAYEKAANECGKLARKHTNGDVSVTVLLIEARTNVQAEAAKVQKLSPQFSPQQKARADAIAAKVAPYLK